MPRVIDAKKAPIGLALIINPTISSETPRDIAYGGKNGETTESDRHISMLHVRSSTNIIDLDAGIMGIYQNNNFIPIVIKYKPLLIHY